MINVTDSKEHTALFYTIKYRNSPAAVRLIESGADFKSRANGQVCIMLLLIFSLP